MVVCEDMVLPVRPSDMLKLKLLLPPAIPPNEEPNEAPNEEPDVPPPPPPKEELKAEEPREPARADARLAAALPLRSEAPASLPRLPLELLVVVVVVVTSSKNLSKFANASSPKKSLKVSAADLIFPPRFLKN